MRCKFCDKVFSNNRELTRHLWKEHREHMTRYLKRGYRRKRVRKRVIR